MKKSQWTKAKETLKAMMLRDIAEFEKDINDYNTLKLACLNGADNFKHLSESGGYLVFDYDLAKLFCTPKKLEELSSRKQFPQGFGGLSWLDIQARALSQAFREIARDRGYKVPSAFTK